MAQWYGLAGALNATNWPRRGHRQREHARWHRLHIRGWCRWTPPSPQPAGDYATSARLYREGRQRFPDAPALAYGELDSLIAADDDAARQLAETAVSRRPGLETARRQRIYHRPRQAALPLAHGPAAVLPAGSAPGAGQFNWPQSVTVHLRSRLDARIRELVPVVKEQIEAQRQRR